MLGVAQILGYSLYDHQTCFETHWLAALPFSENLFEKTFDPDFRVCHFFHFLTPNSIKILVGIKKESDFTPPNTGV